MSRVTSRRTMPLACEGSSIWSAMATLCPALSSFAMYGGYEWAGTPHMGMPWRAVSVTPKMPLAILASSPNIS